MTVSFLGLPFDANSSHLRGPARAPEAIRQALHASSSNEWTEDGVDLGAGETLRDLGDLDLGEDTAQAYKAIEWACAEALGSGAPLICLGGDHSVTVPVVRCAHAREPNLTILHFDAHPDLYEEFEGNRYSHACPFARIMEEGLARRLVQVGIRTLNWHQYDQATRFGVEIISMRNLNGLNGVRLSGPVYISLDLDVLDPAFAPGVSHHEPGGMSVRDVVSAIQSLRVPIVAADIVEYNPAKDEDERTAMVAAKLLKEIAAAMLRKGAEPRADWP